MVSAKLFSYITVCDCTTEAISFGLKCGYLADATCRLLKQPLKLFRVFTPCIKTKCFFSDDTVTPVGVPLQYWDVGPTATFINLRPLHLRYCMCSYVMVIFPTHSVTPYFEMNIFFFIHDHFDQEVIYRWSLPRSICEPSSQFTKANDFFHAKWSFSICTQF